MNVPLKRDKDFFPDKIQTAKARKCDFISLSQKQALVAMTAHLWKNKK